MAQSIHSRGGPYASTAAGIGGLPSILPDVPICAVFMVLYISLAATNMSIFQINRRRKFKFIPSAMLFGFGMSRILTMVFRIVWAKQQHNIQLAIAAQVFVNAGVLLVYIINLLLSQRILRAKQPHIGWHPILRIGSKVLYYLIGVCLVLVITTLVLTLYTLNLHTRAICRDIQFAAMAYLLTFTCLPLLHIALAVMLPKSKDEETFGEGGMSAKILIVTLSSCLSILIAGFKAGATWSPAHPASNPAWFDSKASFYSFSFVPEIIILCVLTFSRFDKRFHVPNGSTRPGDYTRLREQIQEDKEDSQARMS